MNSEHIVKSFDDDLRQIESLITQMGGLVETQISEAITALTRCDKDLASKVRSNDKRIDDLEQEVGSCVVRVLALRQPVAEDLRAMVSVLKVASSLERMGDYAKNIAKRSSVLGNIHPFASSLKVLRRMAMIVQEMLKDVLDAHADRDMELADLVRLRDEDVDQIHNTLFRELLTYMMEEPRNITQCMHLLFVAKNIERMGDHVTGIAEQIHFRVAGKTPDEERPKQDKTSLTTLDPKNGNNTSPAAS